MKIAVFDNAWTYTIDTPYKEPLGGTQSAICYFLEELAANKEHEVYLFNNIKESIIIRNVNHVPFIQYLDHKNFDVFIVSCLPNVIVELKLKIDNPNTLFCLWTGHDVDQNSSLLLDDMKNKDLVDIFMFVSEWQRDRYVERYKVPLNKTLIMRNGIGKPFELYLFGNLEKVNNSMTYCSIPWRGLELLNPIFKQIKYKHSNASLKIFSGLNIYKQEEDTKLYDNFKELKDVECNYGVSQTALAEELSAIDILSYPNTFQETSCITALQAMACGCLVVTSNLGALKESMNGLNTYVDININNFDKNKYIEEFVSKLDKVIRMSKTEKASLRQANRDLIKNNYTWSVICKKFISDITIKLLEYKKYIGDVYVPAINSASALFTSGEWIAHINLINTLHIYVSVNHYHNIKLNNAVCYYKIKHYDIAKKTFKMCRSLKSDFAINKNIALLELERNDKYKFYKYARFALENTFDCTLGSLLAEKLEEDKNYHEAISMYESILKVEPDHIIALNNLGNIFLLFLTGSSNIEKDMDRTYMKSFDNCVKNGRLRQKELVFSNWLFNNLYNWNYSEQDIYERACKWSLSFEKYDNLVAIANKLDRKKKHDKIRIGYISTDFVIHPVGFMFESILKNHNTDLFEIYCYDNSQMIKNDDLLAVKLRSFNNASWRKICETPDDQVLEQMIEDDLDILVDMMGHTRNTRITLLQYKPAKVTISYFAYPSTNGFKETDYKFTDKYANPPSTQKYFCEKLYYLPNGFQCYTPPVPLDGSKTYIRDKYKIHLCCFNNPIKLSIPTIKVFADVLKALPEAKLFLRYIYYKSSFYKEFIMRKFLDHGIDRERIDIECLPLVESLNFYKGMDIVLDPFPYNGGTISSEALYMNTPMITLAGTNYVSRVGVSLLSNLGLEKYVAYSHDDYVQKVVDLARNPEELKDMHDNLRNKMMKSDLADSVSFTNHIEEAYKDIMDKYYNNI